MKTYDLYGFDAPDLEAARRLIQGLLGIRHHDALEDEWREPAFPEKNFLLYVNESPRAEQIAAALLTERAICLLRHQVL